MGNNVRNFGDVLREAIAYALAVLVLVTGALLVAAWFGAAPADADARVSVPACVNEDGSGQAGKCVWDGRHMGNGVGLSYVVRKGGAVNYVTHRRAHRLTH